MSDEDLGASADDIPPEKKYSVAVKGEGLTMERQVDEGTVLAILQLIMAGGLPTTIVPPAPQRTPYPSANPAPQLSEASGERRVSIRNYLDQVGAKNISAKIVAIGTYLNEFEGQTEFSREDIAAGFRNAREIAPGNLPRDIVTTVRLGWIAEDPRSKNQFYVTAVGEEALKSGFEGARASSSRKKKARKPKPVGHQENGESE